MQSRDMLKFDFSGKGLEIVSSSHLCMYRISHIKRFLMFCNINWPNFIAWLSLLLEILVNMYYNYFLTGLRRHKFWK